MIRTTLVLLLLCIAPALFIGCDSEASEQPADRAEVDPSPVETLVLAPTTFTDRFQVNGVIAPDEAIDVPAEATGRLLEAYVDEGDDVQQGQALFRIDVEADEAGQQVLQTQVEAAERELRRLRQLREEGLATEQQIDNAETELESAQKNLAQSRVATDRHIVRSPVDGRVATRYADRGEFAAAGNPLVDIIADDQVLIEASVPESELNHIQMGDDVPVDIPALNTTVDAQVQRIALRAHPATRTFGVELVVDNEDRHMRSGMRARVHFERHTYEDAIVIPRDAILEGFDQREAMIAPFDGEIGNAEVRPLLTGPGSDERILILEGLDAGDRLILRGHRGLIGDAKVEVIDESHQDHSASATTDLLEDGADHHDDSDDSDDEVQP